MHPYIIYQQYENSKLWKRREVEHCGRIWSEMVLDLLRTVCMEQGRAVSARCSSSTKEVQTMVGSCRGSAGAAELQMWGENTESIMHFSSQDSSAVFPWILIFHYRGQVTVFVAPTLPRSREHLEYVTERCNYPQLHYLKVDIKINFPLETKACIVPWNASSILQWAQHCLRSELASKAQKTLSMLNEAFFWQILQAPACLTVFFSISVK